jgi:hypothetical protein
VGKTEGPRKGCSGPCRCRKGLGGLLGCSGIAFFLCSLWIFCLPALHVSEFFFESPASHPSPSLLRCFTSCLPPFPLSSPLATASALRMQGIFSLVPLPYKEYSSSAHRPSRSTPHALAPASPRPLSLPPSLPPPFPGTQVVLALERSRAGGGPTGVTLLRRAVERQDRAVVEGIVKVGREG